MTQALGFTVTKASAIMGVFVAFNYKLTYLSWIYWWPLNKL